MKVVLVILAGLISMTGTWETDFLKAKENAKSSNRLILLNFSGSDWCGPCIKMHKEILDKEVFLEYATKNLVLVQADFPRLKKNRLSDEQQAKNDQLAELYNKEGKFPLTLLLSADGKLLKKWEGYPTLSPEAFVEEIKSASNVAN